VAKVQPLLDPRTQECIVDRLVLCESPRSIASHYGIEESVVQRVRKDNEGEIWRLRASWQDWVSDAEPLASDFNRIVFMGAIARRAYKTDRLREATDALKAIGDVMSKVKKSQAAIADLNILDRIHRGEWEDAMRAMENMERERRENPLLADKTAQLGVMGDAENTPKYDYDADAAEDQKLIEQVEEKRGKKVRDKKETKAQAEMKLVKGRRGSDERKRDNKGLQEMPVED
jgi:hypothetical protein